MELDALTSFKLADVQNQVNLSLVKETLNLQQESLLTLIQSIQESTRSLQLAALGVGRNINTLA